ADMDQPGPDGKTLLDLTKDAANIDPDRWNAFYSSVKDLSTGKSISRNHRGLLPFRVWQIFDAMVGFAQAGDGPQFLCAAGVLTHSVGDASQPLHISFLHDGDPRREGEDGSRPLGKGVHSAYEDDMVHGNRATILSQLAEASPVAPGERISSGRDAAQLT